MESLNPAWMDGIDERSWVLSGGRDRSEVVDISLRGICGSYFSVRYAEHAPGYIDHRLPLKFIAPNVVILMESDPVSFSGQGDPLDVLNSLCLVLAVMFTHCR